MLRLVLLHELVALSQLDLDDFRQRLLVLHQLQVHPDKLPDLRDGVFFLRKFRAEIADYLSQTFFKDPD